MEETNPNLTSHEYSSGILAIAEEVGVEEYTQGVSGVMAVSFIKEAEVRGVVAT